jgi:type VI secretion system protein ImpL
MVSLPDLVEAKEEELEWHAVNIRNRVDELGQRLGLVIPVYLVFTKSDLVRGFVEFFDSLERSGREAVWGCTFPVTTSGEPPHRLFESEFGVLVDSIRARRNAALLTALGSNKVQSIFSFPLQLDRAAQNLSRFVELLFQPSAYQDNPLFRGFYLTSGTQEGLPFDKVVGDVTRKAGVPDTLLEPLSTAIEKKSYFIKSLFTDVVFPDQALAGLSSGQERRLRLLKRTVVGGVAVVSVAILGMALYSFVKNQQFHTALLMSVNEPHHLTASDIPRNVVALEPLRSQMDLLLAYEYKGVPLSHRVGMYRGATLYQPVKDLYLAAFNRLYLPLTRQEIEKQLWAFAKNPAAMSLDHEDDYHYSLLKTYVMLSEPSPLDQPFLSHWLQKIWTEILANRYGADGIPQDVLLGIQKEIEVYTRCLEESRVSVIDADEGMVRKAREVLGKMPLDARVFARIRREGSKRLDPFTLELAMQGKKQGLLVSSYKVPGLFTVNGWKTDFSGIMARAVNESSREAWVLALPDIPREQLEAALKRRYFDEYIRHWLKFLESVRMQLGGALSEKISRLEMLTQKESSPLVALLQYADANTQLDGLLDQAKQQMRLGNLHPVTARFNAFHNFVSASGKETQEPSLQQYLMELEKLREKLSEMEADGGGQAAKNITDHVKKVAPLLRDLDKEIQTLLLKPFTGGIDQELQRLNESWKVKIYDVYAPFFNGRYPFHRHARSTEEAMPAKFAEFFNPQGALWTFYDENLKTFIKQDGEQWKVSAAMGVGMPVSLTFLESLKNARRITEALFPQGSLEPRVFFEVRLQQVGVVGMTNVTKVSLIIDGTRMDYANGPQIYYPFQWPGPSEDTAGAQLEIEVGPDSKHLKSYSKPYLGRWGFFRLLEEAQIVKLRQAEYRLTWKFPTDGGPPIEVQMDLKASGTKDPFSSKFFGNFRLLGQLG